VTNPFLVTERKGTSVHKCPACRDMGCVLPPEIERRHRSGIPAKVLFGNDDIAPCGCPMGREFERMRREWRVPMSERKSKMKTPADFGPEAA
jgi:hypothetical protein